MLSDRNNVRYVSHAGARVAGVFEGDALLKNISITGCCIESTMHVDIKPNTEYRIEIIPETASGIGKFEVMAESRWIRIDGYSCEIGFMITASPRGKLFQRYVDYLNWQSA
jgi:hypothetical protein